MDMGPGEGRKVPAAYKTFFLVQIIAFKEFEL